MKAVGRKRQANWSLSPHWWCWSLRRLLSSLALLAFCAGGWSTKAATWSDDFASTSLIETTTMKFNAATGVLYPTVQIQGWNLGSGGQVTNLDFGDGRHGAFDSTTYSRFGTVVGSTVTINTEDFCQSPSDASCPLQVTSFNLAAGTTLIGTGAKPLEIRSLTDIIVAGTINCSGADGTAMNSNNTVVSSGGTGRCGGGSGGNGGSIVTEATNGTLGGTSLTRAGLGANTANASPAANNVGAAGGGGGGGYSQVATGAEEGYSQAAVIWDSEGGNFDDQGFSEVGGGSGGGGGKPYSGTDVANHSSGGGGAGGGGVVLLSAFRDITVSGSVLANGGNGGGTTGTLRAGAGGGGGGGTIGVWAGRNLSFPLSGVISAMGGSGGASGIDVADAPTGDNPEQGKGGDGGDGRTWITDNDQCNGATCPAGENPPFLGVDEGYVRSVISAFSVVSREIDLRNTAPVLNSFSVTASLSGGSSITSEIATSDQTGFDPTSLWVTASSLVGQPLKRFVRYRLTVDNQDANSPAIVDAVTLDYSGHQQNDFAFTASCASLAELTAPPTATLNPGRPKLPEFFRSRQLGVFMFLWGLPLLLVVVLRARGHSRSRPRLGLH